MDADGRLGASAAILDAGCGTGGLIRRLAPQHVGERGDRRGGIALLVFGNRLPSVARSMGKSLVEFKKGMNEIEEEVKNASSVEAKAPSDSQSKV